jgi:hypothetical protein
MRPIPWIIAGGALALAADDDADGSLTRYEYLKAMARDDFRALRDRVADFIEPER